VVALEASISVEVNELPVVQRRVIDRFGVRGFVDGDSSPKTLRERGSERLEDRSALVNSSPVVRLLADTE
jgi:hypothetical protein